METQREKNARPSVPRFGGWDSSTNLGGAADGYSMVFKQARADKRKRKSHGPARLRDDGAFMAAVDRRRDQELMAAEVQHNRGETRKSKTITYLNCCIRF